MKKKILTVIATLIILACAGSCAILWNMYFDLKAENSTMASTISDLQEENKTTATTANQCKLETEQFMRNYTSLLEELELRYQNLYTLMEKEKEETEEPENTVATPDNSTSECGMSSNSLWMSSNFDDKAEMMQTLASFSTDEIQRAISDYGFFVGQAAENPEHYIVISPVPAN